MVSNTPTSKVYRLRQCPARFDTLKVTELLSQALGDVKPTDIRLQSLAMDLDPFARSPTKVGTLMFSKLPKLIDEGKEQNEWKVTNVALEKPLLLDTHFLGMTPLNDVEREKHELDCVAISGLASHPFGSWQGADKHFMWIRDELPRGIPNIRAVVYGYDTTLKGSKSFQSIQDVAMSLIDHMKASGWAMPSAKPLLFLAHSLGGIILKEAFTILAGGGEQGNHVLGLFKGGIFFGVPSEGMANSHLLTMVKGQANEQLIHDLSSGSEFLSSLDVRFSGLATVRFMHLHWAFETKTSPTILRQADGSFARTGPEEILVSRESATRSRYASRPSAIFPINENHSGMVKFREDDRNLRIVMARLQKSSRSNREFVSNPRTNPKASTLGFGSPGITTYARYTLDDDDDDDASKGWKIKDLADSLQFPDQTHRIDTIDQNFEYTFEWIFDIEKTLISKWLRSGKGLFWIHGKPGCGKSTLMKFIYRNRRTWELLHRFSTPAKQVLASFFFHDRGNVIQKSFEGLLRSILYQVFEALGETLAGLFKPLLEKRSPLLPEQAKRWTIHDLEDTMHLLFRQTYMDLEIFLLLDALDEYDGQPEFISGFLEDLLSTATCGRTRLKILFSSRSWDVFKYRFKSIPSIQLEDYTKDDIEKYCLGTIDQECDDVSNVLGRIIPEVIRRAEGVFLWVKLVLLELASEARQGVDSDGLSNTLNSIPSGLREYYTRTVQRVPKKFRRDAYVILSLVANSTEALTLDKVAYIVECFGKSTYKGYRKAVIKLDRRMYPRFLLGFPNWREKARQKSRIRTSTGILAQLIHTDHVGNPIVELAHQTVKEYVLDQDFKRSILGSDARLIQDNIYSIQAKMNCFYGYWEAAGIYMGAYELAEGLPWNDFVDSIPQILYTDACREIEGPLGYAIRYDMLLYLKEAVRRNSDVLRKTQEKLLSIIPNRELICLKPSIFNDFEKKNGVALGGIQQITNRAYGKFLDWPSRTQYHEVLLEFLFENGYTIEKDPGAFSTLMKEYSSCNIRSPDLCNWLEAKIVVLLRHGQDPNVHLPDWRATSSLRALHKSTTEVLVRELLDHGAEVNAADEAGNTPLDLTLNRLADKSYQPHRFSEKEWSLQTYRLVVLLIERGGIAPTTSRQTWRKCLSSFQVAKLDVAPLLELFDQVEFDQAGKPMAKVENHTQQTEEMKRGWLTKLKEDYLAKW